MQARPVPYWPFWSGACVYLIILTFCAQSLSNAEPFLIFSLESRTPNLYDMVLLLFSNLVLLCLIFLQKNWPENICNIWYKNKHVPERCPCSHVPVFQIVDDSVCGWAFKCLNLCLLDIHHGRPSGLDAFPQLLSLYTNYRCHNNQAKLLKITDNYGELHIWSIKLDKAGSLSHSNGKTHQPVRNDP